MNKQELAEKILKGYSPAIRTTDGNYAWEEEDVIAAIVEAMGVQQEESEYKIEWDIKGEGYQVRFNGEDFAFCETPEHAEYICKCIKSFEAPAKAVEAMPESRVTDLIEYAKKKEQEYFQLSNNRQLFYEAGKSEAWKEIGEYLKKVEAMDSLPAPAQINWQMVESFIEDCLNEKHPSKKAIIEGLRFLVASSSLPAQKGMKWVGTQLNKDGTYSDRFEAIGNDYVASNSNTDDTFLASHSCTSCNSIEQVINRVKTGLWQLSLGTTGFEESTTFSEYVVRKSKELFELLNNVLNDERIATNDKTNLENI